jgi:P-type Ca2+ transporter type 2C
MLSKRTTTCMKAIIPSASAAGFLGGSHLRGKGGRSTLFDVLRKTLVRGGSTSGIEMSSVTTTSPDVDYLYHSKSVGDCLGQLQSSAEVGLSSDQVAQRQLSYGANALSAPASPSLFHLLIEQFQDRLVQILLSIAGLSAALAFFEKDVHATIEPAVILSILIINALIGIYQSKSAEDSLQALKKLQPEFATVLRDGQWQTEVPASTLVPGDIISIRVGDKVPADCRIVGIKTTSFATDEAMLTGESYVVSKTYDVISDLVPLSGKVNMLFSGTMVTNGIATALVVGTGMRTEIGNINRGVQEAKETQVKTPLTEKLDEFGQQLTNIIIGICLSVWFISIPKFSNPVFGSVTKGAIYYAKIAVALGVAAIPEGLPAVITLCLSLGTRRMAKNNVIVRKLSSVETLGCTSVICTDKTGTLTTNQMTVQSLVTMTDSSVSSEESGAVSNQPYAVKERHVSGVSYEPIGAISEFSTDSCMQRETFQDIATISSLCNEAKIEYKEGTFTRSGEPTEAALKVLVEKMGSTGVVKASDPTQLADQCGQFWTSKYNRLAILEFSRDRKSMSVLCSPADSSVGSGRHKASRLFVKGAAEVVLQRCNRIKLEENGKIIQITPQIREIINQKIAEMAQRPQRCIALAYAEGPSLGPLNDITSEDDAKAAASLRDANNFIHFETDMVLVGLVGIQDPARPEAADAILRCKSAGIRVMMITGDSKDTAVAIARDVNIFTADQNTTDHAFTGREFFSLPEEQQIESLRHGNKVFCRTEPHDKQVLIRMLEKLGEITAMTGDGVNDAPALQQAAIGIAMGITGTEVAKNAADMVLADDNFATIVSAVEEGRNIYSNMQTFICFLISSNIGEIATIALATLLGFPEPLTPLHLLWVNLVTDGPPATALGFNPPDTTVMSKAPRPKNEPILSSWLLTRYVITGLYVGFATIGAFVWWYLDKGVSLYELANWGRCSNWADFAHSALAPNWPDNPCEIFTVLKSRPQSMSLSVLVAIEMLKALSAVSLNTSLLKMPPWKNKWLLLGVGVPSILHLGVMYTPLLAKIFSMVPLSLREWKVSS